MIQGVPSFKGFHVTQKGKDSLSDKPVDFIQEDLLPAAKMAKEDDKNCLSVEDDGNVYIETPVYGKFTAYNFPNPKVPANENASEEIPSIIHPSPPST